MMSSHFNFDYDLVCIHFSLDTLPLPGRPVVLPPITCTCLRPLHTLGPDELLYTSPKMYLEVHISPLPGIYIVVEHSNDVATMAQRLERSTVLPERWSRVFEYGAATPFDRQNTLPGTRKVHREDWVSVSKNFMDYKSMGVTRVGTPDFTSRAKWSSAQAAAPS
jgi:hypothetical protein